MPQQLICCDMHVTHCGQISVSVYVNIFEQKFSQVLFMISYTICEMGPSLHELHELDISSNLPP